MRKSNKNNVLLLLGSIIILFFTLIFQTITIVRLNNFENQLANKQANKSDISIDITENEQSKTENNVTSENEATDLVIQEEETTTNLLENIDINDFLANTLFVGDSRTEILQRFTDAGVYSSFCCQIGTNVNDITNVKFTSNNEQVDLYSSVGKFKYKNIIICLGFNELGWQKQDTFIEKYSEVIGNIKTISPSSNIYVVSILHIGKDAKIDNEFENNQRINEYNDLIKSMCEAKGVTFIDLNHYFIDPEGYLPIESSTDGIHFNSENAKTYLEKLIIEILS